jgi:uncharacterized protein YndB with AHSA1/START domain
MRKVEVTEIVNTSPENIIRAFVEPSMLRGWWGVERSLIDARPGGLYVVAWDINPHGFGYLSTGIINEYDPATKLVVGNYMYANPEKEFLGPMSLTVQATQKSHRVAEMYIRQDGYRNGGEWDWYYEAVRTAWPAVAKQLKEYLEKTAAAATARK